MPLPDLPTLIALFHTDPDELGHFTLVDPASVPADYQRLLWHSNHMTVTMEQFYGCSVDVAVKNRLKTAVDYAREIVLTRQTDGQVVQFGIPRLNLNLLADDVRREIESEQIPLGRVLIQHNVLREVEPIGIWKVEPGPALLRYFEMTEPVTTFGRTALIRLDGEPAVELLEIATPLEITLRGRPNPGIAS